MSTNNGTPYTDEQWKAWYANKSSKDLAIDEQERLEAEQDALAGEAEAQAQAEAEGEYQYQQEQDAQAEYEAEQGPEGY